MTDRDDGDLPHRDETLPEPEDRPLVDDPALDEKLRTMRKEGLRPEDAAVPGEYPVDDPDREGEERFDAG